MGNKTGVTMLRIVTIVVVLIIIGGIYFVFSNLFSTDSLIPDERIVAVQSGEMVCSVVATGKIEPVTKIDVKSKASGIIQQFYVDEGDMVERGQVLLELDRQELEASVREARAHVMARQALLEKAAAEMKSAALALEKAKEEARNQDLEFARREYERIKEVYDAQLVAKSDLDMVEQRFRAEEVRDNVLKKNVLLREAEYYTSETAVHQARADLHAGEAALQRAEENLRYATIRSPIAGLVLKRHLEEGDAVSSILQLGSNATLIMVVGDTRELYFKGDVDESDVGEIHTGQPVRLTVETYRDRRFEGEVFRISPMGLEEDNVTRFEVRVRLLSEHTDLRVNMSANAEIILARKADVLQIPETALVYDENKAAFVDLIHQTGEEQLVRRVPVDVGISNGSRVEVIRGLSGEDRVVLQ
ncbi:MAG: efflux RND transporter periplasmic adaptor subunit [Acidobacteria bacterium]|nr:efflux RND transporter periplasmic adaptor subunit [Acidobacteriota bacterium]